MRSASLDARGSRRRRQRHSATLAAKADEHAPAHHLTISDGLPSGSTRPLRNTCRQIWRILMREGLVVANEPYLGTGLGEQRRALSCLRPGAEEPFRHSSERRDQCRPEGTEARGVLMDSTVLAVVANRRGRSYRPTQGVSDA